MTLTELVAAVKQAGKRGVIAESGNPHKTVFVWVPRWRVEKTQRLIDARAAVGQRIRVRPMHLFDYLVFWDVHTIRY